MQEKRDGRNKRKERSGKRAAPLMGEKELGMQFSLVHRTGYLTYRFARGVAALVDGVNF